MDILYVFLLVLFFVLLIGLVSLCERTGDRR